MKKPAAKKTFDTSKELQAPAGTLPEGIHTSFKKKSKKKSPDAALLEKYAALFDFSPTGYFTIDRPGVISELNLGGALMLGRERTALIAQRFDDFIMPAYLQVYADFISKVFGGNVKTSCEIALNNQFNPALYVQVDGIVMERGEKCLLVLTDISERRMIEIELENRDKIFNLSQDMHCIAGFDGYLKILNPSWSRVLGWTNEELLARKFIEFVHPDDLEKTLAIGIGIRDSNDISHFETRIVCKDGTYKHLEWNAAPNASDKTIISIARDVTEKRKAEEAINAERKLLRTLIDNLPDAIYIKDAQGKKIITNPIDLRIMNCDSASEALGKTDLEIFGKEKGGKHYHDDMEVIATGQSKVDQEEIFTDRQGREICLLTSKVALRNDDGVITGLLGIGRDITQRKASELALLISNQRFEFVSKAAFDAIWDWDIKAGNLYWGENFESIYGYSVQDSKTNIKIWNSNVHPGDFDRVAVSLNEVIDGSLNNWMEEYRFRKSNGEYAYVQDRGIMVRDEYGKGTRMIGAMQDITLQKLTQLKLLETEKRYRALVENSADGVAILTPEGKPVYVAPSIKNILGYSEAEAMELDLMSLTHPDDLAGVAAMMEKVMEQPGIPVEGYTSRLKHKDGSWRWLEDTITNMLHVPFINGIVENFRDVTEKMSIERNIITEKELSDSVINNLPGIFYLYDAQGNFIRWNKNLETVSGYSGDEIRQMKPADFFAPENREAAKTEVRILLEENTPGIEINLFTRDKNEIPYHINSITTSYEGQPCQMVMGIDITDRKKAEAENQKLAMIANLTINAVVLTDPSGNIQWVNKGFERITGYELPDIAAKNLFTCLEGPDTNPETVTYMRKCMHDSIGAKAEMVYYNKAGQKYWVDSEMVPMLNQEKEVTGFMLIERDITDRKNTETELLWLNQNLNKRANELVVSNAELERFAYVASHDLQEPLRMVSSFMQLLLRNYEPDLDDKARQYVRFAVDGADRMKRLIMDLLEYSRVGTNKDIFEDTDMNFVMQEVITLFEKTGDENDPVISYPLLPVIHSNRSQMVQLLQNLIGNAVKYKSDRNPVIDVNFREEEDQFIFMISDNGIGIEPQYFEKIFILFQRLHIKEEYSGTGIGLAICKKIIELHGGNIWVQSVPGKGSTFYFTIRKHFT